MTIYRWCHNCTYAQPVTVQWDRDAWLCHVCGRETTGLEELRARKAGIDITLRPPLLRRQATVNQLLMLVVFLVVWVVYIAWLLFRAAT